MLTRNHKSVRVVPSLSYGERVDPVRCRTVRSLGQNLPRPEVYIVRTPTRLKVRMVRAPEAWPDLSGNRDDDNGGCPCFKQSSSRAECLGSADPCVLNEHYSPSSDSVLVGSKDARLVLLTP